MSGLSSTKINTLKCFAGCRSNDHPTIVIWKIHLQPKHGISPSSDIYGNKNTKNTRRACVVFYIRFQAFYELIASYIFLFLFFWHWLSHQVDITVMHVDSPFRHRQLEKREQKKKSNVHRNGVREVVKICLKSNEKFSNEFFLHWNPLMRECEKQERDWVKYVHCARNTWKIAICGKRKWMRWRIAWYPRFLLMHHKTQWIHKNIVFQLLLIILFDVFFFFVVQSSPVPFSWSEFWMNWTGARDVMAAARDLFDTAENHKII